MTNSMAMAKTVKGVSATMSAFLMLLASVSLVVGGMVIANIMLISVNEQKKEIGIRRAFGSRAQDIMHQFLAEVLMVTISGGICGAGLGAAIAMGMAMMQKMPAILSWEPLAIALLFSTVVGLLAGIQPARKAAAMDPVTAIRG